MSTPSITGARLRAMADRYERSSLEPSPAVLAEELRECAELADQTHQAWIEEYRRLVANPELAS